MARFLRAAGLAACLLATHATAAKEPAAPRPASFPEHERQCRGKDGWSDPAPPVRIFANVYDVGTCGIVALLVTGPRGHVLIDAATAEAVPPIARNITRLGFRLRDVKLLLSSHEHVDHADGLRGMQRLTGATMVATAAARGVLESGAPAVDDPQRGGLPPFAGVRVGRLVRDGEMVTLGPVRLTAHTTPGHSPGGTSWTWRSCDAGVCRAMVYADSLSAISADGYRFTDHPAYVATFRTTLAKVAALPCDILVTPHPGASDLYARLAGTTPLVDRRGCAAYAAAAGAKLDKRLADEARQLRVR
ncbi:subclass B3 metallo-beta-lactamase [Sphingomonas ginsenosidivorax]|uniref:Subclass B3 metallo-beta-lactamase n=1 Tax=Sphingomonas ginsenosidivorax TaxID=862135 RepID=A0A5C6UHJ5_9SPHN|nr:subclass B3 metallo-beta-lactamase [Sphingomonas ginsenosidivorax]TXC72272.1 subclass B3 metallo-beta-lactamase [Sphingomonas ginsenosidivorax]